jgi:two-component system phosphate regulon sensor histidine kinase PhoR
MLYLITAALGVGLAIALKRLRDHRQTVRSLQQAIEEKRPLFLENETGVTAADALARLRSATNNLIIEFAHSNQVRSGQLAQLEATLGSLQEAVLIVDADNHLLLANRALQAIFPDARNILHQRLETVLHSAAFLGYVEAVRSGQAEPRREIEFVEGNGPAWLEVTGTLIALPDDPHGNWALFVLHDITKQKMLECVRKDFVANVSHELRTPLSIIKGYIETLVAGHQAMPLEDRDRFLRTIQRHTERLNSLLEDLLSLARLESVNPGLRREPTPLADLLTNVIDDMRGRSTASEHVLSLTVDSAISLVPVDPIKITQVCENLLDNALKYTPSGSRIDVTARLLGREVEVCVRDTGPGIPEADIPHIFERFYRVDKGRSRDKGGTGLGLSIVKHIVQLHGGRVGGGKKRIDEGNGVLFHPTAAIVMTGDATGRHRRGKGRGSRCLLADDPGRVAHNLACSHRPAHAFVPDAPRGI